MAQGAKDSHLKNPPDSDNYDMKVARIRMKGFHEDSVSGNELDAIAVYPVNPFGNPITNEIMVRTAPGGIPQSTRFDTPNDHDYTYTVPAGKRFELESVLVEYNASADVGNRSVIVVIGNGTNVLFVSPVLALTASQRGGLIVSPFFSGFITTFPTVALDLGATYNSKFTSFSPFKSLPEGWTIRIYEYAVNIVADDMILSINGIEYDA